MHSDEVLLKYHGQFVRVNLVLQSTRSFRDSDVDAHVCLFAPTVDYASLYGNGHMLTYMCT